MEELLNCISSIAFLDEKQLIVYLDAYNIQFLYQKTGFILEHYKNELQLSEGFIDYCKSKIGEIDFIFQSGMNTVPFEVKAAENLQSKSLKSYCQKYAPKYAILTSMSDYRNEEWLINMPLYAMNELTDVAK